MCIIYERSGAKSVGSREEPGIHCSHMHKIFLEFQASAILLADGHVLLLLCHHRLIAMDDSIFQSTLTYSVCCKPHQTPHTESQARANSQHLYTDMLWQPIVVSDCYMEKLSYSALPNLSFKFSCQMLKRCCWMSS